MAIRELQPRGESSLLEEKRKEWERVFGELSSQLRVAERRLGKAEKKGLKYLVDSLGKISRLAFQTGEGRFLVTSRFGKRKGEVFLPEESWKTFLGIIAPGLTLPASVSDWKKGLIGEMSSTKIGQTNLPFTTLHKITAEIEDQPAVIGLAVKIQFGPGDIR